jgi:death-on-curing protein
VDGNKRTAFVAVYAFLGMNGFDLVTTDAEVVLATLGLASGEIDEEGFAAWIRDRMSGG